MDVKFTNQEYTDNLPIWQKVRDCVAGQKAVKDRDWPFTMATSNNLTSNNIGFINPVYLPMPNPTDTSAENRAMYAQLLQRALFAGFTSRTLKGVMGMAFKTPPKIEFPTQLEYLEDNVDGSGIGIEQQAQEVLRDNASIGRAGLYVDYPQTNGEVSAAQQELGGIRATINFYDAESIMDWDCMSFGASTLLSYVKLREKVCERDENYTVQIKYNYRVLELISDGLKLVYMVTVYDDGGEAIEGPFEPKAGDGSTLDHIPFHFAGSTNNRPNVDEAPLIEIADVNIGHYRNSADFEGSAFKVGQPTTYVTGLSQQWVDQNFKQGVAMGSGAILTGPVGSAFGLLQVNPNTMAEAGMRHKEEIIIQLGGRLITDSTVNTATEAAITYEAEGSSLSVGAGNVNNAYESAIADVALFTFKTKVEAKAAAEASVMALNTEFLGSILTAEAAEAMMRLWQGHAISKSVLDQKLKAGGIIADDVKLEVMNAEIETTPGGINLDDPE